MNFFYGCRRCRNQFQRVFARSERRQRPACVSPRAKITEPMRRAEGFPLRTRFSPYGIHRASVQAFALVENQRADVFASR